MGTPGANPYAKTQRTMASLLPPKTQTFQQDIAAFVSKSSVVTIKLDPTTKLLKKMAEHEKKSDALVDDLQQMTKDYEGKQVRLGVMQNFQSRFDVKMDKFMEGYKLMTIKMSKIARQERMVEEQLRDQLRIVQNAKVQ